MLIVLFDLAKYDSSYINRNSLTFSVNNLNSQKVKKIFLHYNNLYNNIAFKFSKNHNEYWKIEDSYERESLPETKTIHKKNPLKGFLYYIKMQVLTKETSRFYNNSNNIFSYQYYS